jgi:hypothetical protein
MNPADKGLSCGYQVPAGCFPLTGVKVSRIRLFLIYFDGFKKRK